MEANASLKLQGFQKGCERFAVDHAAPSLPVFM